ncbi:MAG: hypothetical protein K0R48_1375 [Gammaproteobacteria bacterium]|jgi:hypothetical protein|nr:hypothetical protein [Gammaproteobacteria bacterium]
MKILTHNPAFAQVERVFLIYHSTHFDRIIPIYSLSYPEQHKMSLKVRGIALSRRISTGGVHTRT